MMKPKKEQEEFEFFCLNNFKRWIEGQDQPMPMKRGEITGIIVDSKIPFKRLLEKIDTQAGELEEVARDFKDNGGTILEVHGSEITVKVNSGSFMISRAYIRRR